MIWLFVGLLTVVLVEVFLRLPLISAALDVMKTGRRASKTMQRRKASDHWKEKVFQAYAVRTMKGAVILGGGLALIAVIGTVLAIGFDKIAPGTTAALLSVVGLIVSLVVATGYIWVRSRFVGR